jgi:hypothetical protein
VGIVGAALLARRAWRAISTSRRFRRWRQRAAEVLRLHPNNNNNNNRGAGAGPGGGVGGVGAGAGGAEAEGEAAALCAVCYDR